MENSNNDNSLDNSKVENIKGYVWHNYKMKYAKDKRGFWLIVNYKKHKYFGFIEEGVLGLAINNNQTAATIEKIIDSMTEKIKQKTAIA